MSNRKVVVNVKTLYFEGAGWEKAERSINTIGNCRVRTAFHLDNGKGVIRHYNGYNKKWLIDVSSDSWLKTIIEVS